ncbi:RidA family protein [Palleronia sp. LCG004]|uniref:RidA family protein n=1 Tax=Palleronia sp. LCG004 TaxID=3079304 RepID=UPI002942DAD3|nr:Rid family hydrolase [Palleronia sp. LCG004]WOI58013.1 Rid family hydrolase [Palleronia sp. LCG004]
MRSRSLSAAAGFLFLATSAIAQDGGVGAEGVYPDGIVPIAPYSPGMMVGDTLYVSGQIPYVDGAIPAEASDGTDDIMDQTRIVMDNISAVLEEAGMTLENVVMASVFLTDLGNYGDFNTVYGPYWTDQDWTPPARAAVEVGALPGSTEDAPVLVEISVIAAR